MRALALPARDISVSFLPLAFFSFMTIAPLCSRT
jgi:hypothetical protein